jgi:hypothetical protein
MLVFDYTEGGPVLFRSIQRIGYICLAMIEMLFLRWFLPYLAMPGHSSCASICRDDVGYFAGAMVYIYTFRQK